DLAAQLMAQNHRIFDPGQRMRGGARRERAVVDLVQIAAADAVVENAELHFAGAHAWLRHVFEPQVGTAMKNGCSHESPLYDPPASGGARLSRSVSQVFLRKQPDGDRRGAPDVIQVFAHRTIRGKLAG